MLARAAASGRRARIRYILAAGDGGPREVDVLGLGWRSDGWLGAAWCHRRHAFRLLRLARVAEAEPTSLTVAERAPRGFDPRHFSTIGFLAPGSGPATLATVRLEPPLSDVAAVLFPSALFERTWREVVHCHLRATDLAAVRALVASLGPAASLLDPAAAREAGASVRRSGL